MKISMNTISIHQVGENPKPLYEIKFIILLGDD